MDPNEVGVGRRAAEQHEYWESHTFLYYNSRKISHTLRWLEKRTDLHTTEKMQ